MYKREKRDYCRARYEMCLRLHFCTQCRRQDELTLAGGTRCALCREKCREREAERYADPDRRRAHNLNLSERYYLRRAAGLCVKCGKPALPGRCMCGPCGERNRESCARSRRRKSNQEVE